MQFYCFVITPLTKKKKKKKKKTKKVDIARNQIFSKNDSIMDLLRTQRSSTSLVIYPEKFGNLARFLSGINNTNKKSQ